MYRVAFINQGHILACDTPQNLKSPLASGFGSAYCLSGSSFFDDLEEIEGSSFLVINIAWWSPMGLRGNRLYSRI